MTPHSTVVLHDVATGVEEVVHETPDLIEAPNWSPCGTFLVLNGAGRVFRLDLASREIMWIDAGTLTALNNDHGISPDGATLVVSQSPARGTSCIYTLPITGGMPRRVTPRVPSYFHGWSPDGTTLTYTARRDGLFQICTIPVAGGAETQLTSGPGHKDGPDYSADGQWIWFNSDHHGRTPDIWRIRTDGTDLQQMTDDAPVNWFPHPSPDGRHVLYLAYPEDTEGHPRDKDVSLMLMPQAGGPARRLVSFFGGQGTVNVPNWSPDSARFAYVRYARPEVT